MPAITRLRSLLALASTPANSRFESLLARCFRLACAKAAIAAAASSISAAAAQQHRDQLAQLLIALPARQARLAVRPRIAPR